MGEGKTAVQHNIYPNINKNSIQYTAGEVWRASFKPSMYYLFDFFRGPLEQVPQFTAYVVEGL